MDILPIHCTSYIADDVSTVKVVNHVFIVGTVLFVSHYYYPVTFSNIEAEQLCHREALVALRYILAAHGWTVGDHHTQDI